MGNFIFCAVKQKKIVFDGIIADSNTNQKFKAKIKDLLFRRQKLNIYLVFIKQSYFSVPKKVRLNSTHYLIMKIHNKQELQITATNHSADIDYKDFMNIYRHCTDKRDKILIYNSQYSFVKFRDNSELKEMSLDSMQKRLQNFYKFS